MVIWLVTTLLIILRKFKKLHKKNNSETNTNEHDKEIPKEKYISPEKRQETIDDLKLKW